MPKTHLLVISPPDHPVLSKLAPLRDLSETSISNDPKQLRKLAAAAEVILYCGFGGQEANLAQLWRHMKSVRWVQSVSAGVEEILFPELIQSAVIVTNARGAVKRALAEFTMLGMLYHFKQVRRLVDNQRDRKWDDHFRVQLAGVRVMGVVGYGETGRECAILAKGLGLKIVGLRRNPQKPESDPILDRLFKLDELNQMLSEIDVLVCAAPLTRATRHMISDAQFKVMKPTAIVINVGRGPVIDEGALIRALQSHRIAGLRWMCSNKNHCRRVRRYGACGTFLFLRIARTAPMSRTTGTWVCRFSWKIFGGIRKARL